MFIVWGTKEKKKKSGYCAALCKICHEIRTFKATEIYNVSHLYYIPLGRYKFVSTELVCTVCKNTEFSVDTAYDLYCDQSNDLTILKEMIPENLLSQWEQSVQNHKKIQQDPSSLSKEERVDKMLESFLALENKLTLAIQKGPNIDSSALPGCLTFIGLVLFIIFFGESFMSSSLGQFLAKESGTDGFGIGMLMILIVGGGQVLWLLATNRSRFFKKQIYPHLAVSLAPFKPNIQELTQIRQILKEQKLNMRYFNIPKLQMAISEQQLKRPNLKR